LTAIATIFFLTLLTGLVWVAVVFGIAVGLGRLRSRSGVARSSVSVLIAVRNEEDNIGLCLEALARQDYPADLREIVVIDDNSTDRTAEIVSGFTGAIPGLRLIQAGKPPEGIAPKKHAIVTGLEATTGEVILTTDGDCVPPAGWITGMSSLFEPDVDAVVGYSPLKGRGFVGALSSFDSLVNGVISAGTIGLGAPSSAVGRNFGYRRSAWRDVGGYGRGAAGASGDDDLLLQRISATGGKVRFAVDPDTFVPARAKESFAEWWRMKRRHFSAGKRYRPGLVLIGILLYLFNPVLLVITGMAAAGYLDRVVVAAIWGAKISIDGMTLSRGASLFSVKDWVMPWLFAELVSPLLLTVLLPASMVGRIRWKGRTLKR